MGALLPQISGWPFGMVQGLVTSSVSMSLFSLSPLSLLSLSSFPGHPETEGELDRYAREHFEGIGSPPADLEICSVPDHPATYKSG